MTVNLLTEHHLEFRSLKGGHTGSSEPTLVKTPHCWKSHVTAHMLSMRQVQCVPTAYVTKNKETYFEIYTHQVSSCSLPLSLPNISNCQSVLKYLSLYRDCIYLDDSYISKFEFMTNLQLPGCILFYTFWPTYCSTTF